MHSTEPSQSTQAPGRRAYYEFHGGTGLDGRPWHSPFGTRREATFAELIEIAKRPKIGGKHDHALVFADLRETTCPPGCGKPHKVHGTGVRNEKASLTSVSWLAFDVDEATEISAVAWLVDVRPTLDGCLVWPTWSTVAGKKPGIGLRIVFDISRPLLLDEFSGVRAAAIQYGRLDLLVRENGETAVDPAPKSPTNKFYLTAPRLDGFALL
jgi:hypothetical protein